MIINEYVPSWTSHHKAVGMLQVGWMPHMTLHHSARRCGPCCSLSSNAPFAKFMNMIVVLPRNSESEACNNVGLQHIMAVFNRHDVTFFELLENAVHAAKKPADAAPEEGSMSIGADS